MATAEATVLKALERMKSTLSDADARMFSDTTLADVVQEARVIEKEQGARRDLRYMRRIEPYLRTLQEYAGVVEVLCQGYPPMSFVWVGPVLLSRSCIND